MEYILNKMDEIIRAIHSGAESLGDFVTEVVDFFLAILNALFMGVLVLTIPIWLIPYALYCRYRNKKESDKS